MNAVFERREVSVLDSPMEVLLFRPAGSGPHPGILLAQHLPVAHAGLANDPFTVQTAARLAEAGYIVAVPFLFHWWPREADMAIKRVESRDDWTVADLQAAEELLKAEPDVDPQRIAVVGHCWGGRVAWLAACHLPELAAAAVFYGGNVKKALGAGNQPLIELARHINCPVIGFFGNEDTNPSPEDVEDYSAALAAAGVPHEFHQYDGAGHAFQNFSAGERFCAAASADAWDKLLVFLAEQLAPEVQH